MFFCETCTHRGFHAAEGGSETTCELCPACQVARREAAEKARTQ